MAFAGSFLFTIPIPDPAHRPARSMQSQDEEGPPGYGDSTPFFEVEMARKRELIEPNPGDKRYVRRDENGRFTKDQVDVGRSLAADQRQHAKTRAKSGQGDKGDR
jgi:hypothetical protein